MILSILEILGVALICAVFAHFIWKKKSIFSVPLWLYFFSCALAAHFFAGQLIPWQTTLVTVEATSQAGAGSTGQVYIENYIIDGLYYEPDDAVSGNWFWIDGMYCYLEENDTRLTYPITQQIVLAVPAGLQREIVFFPMNIKALYKLMMGIAKK